MEPRLNELNLFRLAAGLLAAGLVLNLGLQPLFLEEPRRALVAMEMLDSGNYWAPTLLGQWYYNKPPLYNWLLLASVRLWGGWSEYALRLPTVLSVIGIVWLMLGAGKKYLDITQAWAAGLFFAAGSSLLLYFSYLAEIDLFYSLVTFAGLLAIYYFGQQERYWAMFGVVYATCAAGLLTKGLPSLAFTAISLLVYLLDQRKWRLLFSPAHFAGIGLLALIVAGYGYMYARFHDPLNLLQTLVGESSDRTVVANTAGAFFKHLIIFPFDLLKDFLPAGLAILFLFRRDWRDFLLKRHPFIRFCTLMLLANLALYWISPGTRMRYVYPLYPFAAFILAWAYQCRTEAPGWTWKAFRYTWGGLLLLLTPGMLALNWVPDLQFLPYRLLISIAGVLAFGAISYLWWKRPDLTLATVFLAMAVGRLIFDLTAIPQRAYDTGAQRNKALAVAIAEKTKDAPLHIAGEEKVISYTTMYYLNVERGGAVRRQDSLVSGHYYILPDTKVSGQDSILLEMEYERSKKLLIKRR